MSYLLNMEGILEIIKEMIKEHSDTITAEADYIAHCNLNHEEDFMGLENVSRGLMIEESKKQELFELLDRIFKREAELVANE